MRKAFLVAAAVLVAACAKPDDTMSDTAAVAVPPPPAEPAAVNVADLKGTWAAHVMPADRDTVLTTVEIISTGTMDGWTMSLPNGAKPAVKIESVGGDSVVSTAGPYPSATRRGQRVTTHSIMHFRGDSVHGVTHATFANGDTATLRLMGARKSP